MNYVVLPLSQGSKPMQLTKFIKAAQGLKDRRDNRGKRHSLPFVLCGVTLAILSGRASLSSIQRYIAHRIDWLRAVTKENAASVVSRAQLPRILATLDHAALNALTMQHFGVYLLAVEANAWQAVDGKALRGIPGSGGQQRVRIITAVDQDTCETIAQAKMQSAKKGEIAAVRTFLHETGLETANITLDALHMNPKTTAQIAQAGGHYLIQTKRNQAELYALLTHIAQTTAPFAVLNQQEKGHGRHGERWAWFYAVAALPFAERWQHSALNTLTVVMRQTISTADAAKISLDISFYLSNYARSGAAHVQPASLAQAIRRHWGVESVNWIRDVTFQADHVHTKDADLAQLLATIRTFAIRLLQRAKFTNFQAAIERFANCPALFETFLTDAQML